MGKVMKKVLGIELLAFLVLITVVWADEVVDFSNVLFRQPKQDLNLIEAIFESALVLILGGAVLYYTKHLMDRIQYLEGLVVICSFCKRVRLGNKWQAIEEFLSRRSPMEFSHSICEQCLHEHYGDVIPEKPDGD